MANLLPKKERKRFEWEYRSRLFIVVLFFFGVTAMFGSALLLPSYFVSQSKEESIKRQSELLQKTIIVREKDTSVATLLATKQKIDQLTVIQNRVLQTKVIQTIIQNTDSNITIRAFYYERKGDTQGEMKISGTARSRTSLLAFSDRLKKESLFSGVDLPVSSLAQDSNITFSIVLTGDF
ncbi:MAG: hypothetical protein WD509_02940 [Candidatus Paceibacterota bacterium]